jgi:hypothetical protein
MHSIILAHTLWYLAVARSCSRVPLTHSSSSYVSDCLWNIEWPSTRSPWNSVLEPEWFPRSSQGFRFRLDPDPQHCRRGRTQRTYICRVQSNVWSLQPDIGLASNNIYVIPLRGRTYLSVWCLFLGGGVKVNSLTVGGSSSFFFPGDLVDNITASSNGFIFTVTMSKIILSVS